MTPGGLIGRIAGACCSEGLRHRVLEPAIADLQHDYARATTAGQRVRALAGGYAAFWQSLGSCVAADACAPASLAFSARVLIAFIAAVSVAAAVEAWVLQTAYPRREQLLMLMPYVGFSVRTNTAHLRFGVPLAMFPALFYAARRTAQFSRGAAVRAILGGALLTLVASGWVAPSIEHGLMVQQQDAYIRATNFYITPIEWRFDRYPPAKTWPELIRGAAASDRHRYVGYPTYVAPEDRGLRRWHLETIEDHLQLVGLALMAGILGWIVGTLNPGTLNPEPFTRY